jgi:hypothetical protein
MVAVSGINKLHNNLKSTTMKQQIMKEQLLNGAIIELTDTQSENELMVSFSKRLNKFVQICIRVKWLYYTHIKNVFQYQKKDRKN